MKTLLLISGFTLVFSAAAKADYLKIDPVKADNLVKAYVARGIDPYETHTYFQAGVTLCNQVFDEQGNYFPSGKIGDYIGERCLIYGDFEDSDQDGVLRSQVLIPSDDRDMTAHPEIKKQLDALRAIRLTLEDVVIPFARTVQDGEKQVVVQRTIGIDGMACDGIVNGARQCEIKLWTKCPAR